MLTTNLMFTVVILIMALLLSKTSASFINKIATNKQVLPQRSYYVNKFFQFLLVIMTLITLLIVWNIKFGGIMVFASSIFAIIGVALFAQWSMLSNLTASIIIFFTFPARVGDKIKVIDGDNSISGEILEISLFQIVILNDENDTILYPNNLFLQKPIMKISHKKEEKTTK